MRVLGLVSLLFLVVPTLSAQDRFGEPVVSLRIEGGPASVLEDLPIGPGTRLTRRGLREAMQTLYDRGGYSEIEVEAVDAPGGVTLVFHVDAPYFFSTVRVEPRRVLERSLSSYINLPYGQRFSVTRLEQITEEVRGRLEAEGYFSADIEPRYTRDEDTRLVVVVFEVQTGSPATIENIRFEGPQQTFSEEQLASAFGVSVGSRYLDDDILSGEDGLRALFADVEGRAGFLDTTVEVSHTWRAETNTVDLVVRIEPGAYAYVDLRGAELSDDEVRELVPIFEEGSVDADLIEEGRIAILEHFVRQGYFDAGVTTPAEPIVFPMDPDRPEESLAAQIVYDIDLGDRYSVAAIRINGNTLFEDRVIRDAIGVSSRGVFSRGVYSPELLEDAANTVRAMYRNAGLAGTGVEVMSQIERDAVTVTFDIREGNEQHVAAVDVEGNLALTRDEVMRAGGITPGQSYRPADLEAARRAIMVPYHARGYAEVRVRGEADASADGSVRIRYLVEEGDRYDIGRIVVAGNTRTRTTVVRRNAEPLREEAPYDPEAILEAQRNLYATGLFSRVDILPLERDRNGRRDLLIQIEEAGPLLLTYGVGIQQGLSIQEPASTSGSDVDVRGTVEIVHSNLWGLDRSLSTRVQGSRREQRFQMTYREPQLFNWDLDGFASLFVERTQRPQFDATRIDFSLQTLYQISGQDNLLITASFETVDLGDIRFTRRPTDEEGRIQVATIGGSWVHDTRDDVVNPRRGNYFLGTLRVGNRAYGSEVNFTSLFTQFSLYRPARSSVIAASARFGWNQPYGGTTGLPITERYFAGGSTTLRAFGLDEAGPEGGGNALFLINAEYRHPIPFMMSELSGALFYDTGTIFKEISDFTVGDFTHTAGYGLRYETPLGPVRVDLGVNLNRQPARVSGGTGERSYKVHFTLGHAF